MRPRADLLALDETALVSLGNRGLYKRARKELAKNVPEVALVADGTLQVRFSDATVVWPEGRSLAESRCSCGAERACRHRVAAVLAYQATASRPRSESATDASLAVPAVPESDDELRERLGERILASARRRLRQRLSVVVRWGPSPIVLLPTCTVRFFVPWALEHARCDCEARGDCEHLALALWAARLSPRQEGEHQVELGLQRETGASVSEVDELRQLGLDLVANGVAGLEGLRPRVEDLGARLRRRRKVWLVDVLESLLHELEATARGELGADPSRIADLLVEVEIRTRGKPSSELSQDNLHGDAPAGETKLDQVVLRGLGARYRVVGRTGHLSLFFREGENQDPLVLERSWVAEEGAALLPGSVVGSRRLAGSTALRLSSGCTTSRGVRRFPNRRIEIASQRMLTAATSAPNLRPGVDTQSLRDIRAQLVGSNPPQACPRLKASRVVALSWPRVEAVAYDPGQRAVWGWLSEGEAEALVVSGWRSETPGAPAILARALLKGARFLTAEASLDGGRLRLDPILVGFEQDSVSVDLAQETELPELRDAELPEGRDPLAALVDSVRHALGELVRRGAEHPAGAQLGVLRTLADRAEGASLHHLARCLRRFEVDEGRAEAWLATARHVLCLAHVASH